jgi:predicted transcriptional regulator
MAGSKKHLIPQFEKLFIREHMTQKACCEALGISAPTGSRWIKERNMEKRRQDLELSAVGVQEKLRKDLAVLIQNSDPKDSGYWDKLSKAVKSILSLEPEIDRLGNTILTMDDLNQFLNLKHPEILEMFQEVLPDFLVFVREKYRERI